MSGWGLLQDIALAAQDRYRLQPQCVVLRADDPAGLRCLEGRKLDKAVVEFARSFIGPVSDARSEYVCEVLACCPQGCDDRYLVEAIANPLLLALSGEHARQIHLCYDLAQRCRIALPRDLDWSKDMLRALAWASGRDGPRARMHSAIDWMVIDYVCLNLTRDDLPLDDARYSYLAARLKDMIHVLLSAMN